jgi:hypothetical protein
MKYVWILLSLIIGVCLAGCQSSQSLKVVTDITPDGEVTYHTEYNVEF